MMNTVEFVEKINLFECVTPRLRLRKMQPSDADINVLHEQNPAIMKYIRDIEPLDRTKEKVASIVKPYSGKEGEWFAFAVEQLPESCNHQQTDFRYIGTVLGNIRSAAYSTIEIGYRADPTYHRQGFMFEATPCVVQFLWQFNDLHKIVAYCVAENQASYRLMEKLGMKREGCLRQYSTINGIWYDELVYGMLRDDFIQLN